MRFKLTIDMDNAAFEDPEELPRILRELAEAVGNVRMQAFGAMHYLRDANGNGVGRWEIREE